MLDYTFIQESTFKFYITLIIIIDRNYMFMDDAFKKNYSKVLLIRQHATKV